MRRFLSQCSAISGVILLLGGCALGPDYQQPTLSMPDQFHVDLLQGNGISLSSDAEDTALALRGWQEIYPDPRLQTLISQGLENNLDLAIAASRLREAQAARRIARSTLFPSLDLSLEKSRESGSELVGDSSIAEDTYVLQGLLSWELDLWGVNRRRAEVAAAQLRQNQMSFYGTRVSLIGAIASTYFQLQDVTQQKVITEETMESRRQTLNILKLRKANGIISGLEVRQAEVSLAEVEAKLPRLDDTIAELENQLRLALGQMPGDVEVTPIAESHTLPDVIPAGLPSVLLQRRPDIRAAEESLHAATAGIGVAKGALFPQLALTTEFGTETEAFADLLKRDARAWAVDFGLLQPLFHAGAKRAALSAAEEQAQQALFSFHKTVLVAMGEVSNALGNYHRACAVASVNRRLVSSSQEYLRLATLQYRNGVLGYIDVLDAQRQLFSAQLALSQAERDRRLAMTDLYKSLGGGWLDAEGNPDTGDNK